MVIDKGNYKLYKGDCLEVMKNIPDKSIDMILADLPYNKLTAKWDKLIPMNLLWEQYRRIIKDNGAMILFAQQPFTSLIVASNVEEFRHNIVWHMYIIVRAVKIRVAVLNCCSVIYPFGYIPVKIIMQ